MYIATNKMGSVLNVLSTREADIGVIVQVASEISKLEVVSKQFQHKLFEFVKMF